MENETSWYKKTNYIILLLLFFFPVGLYLMWKYTDWDNKVKWGITGFFLIFTISTGFTETPEQKTNDLATNNDQEKSAIIENEKETQGEQMPGDNVNEEDIKNEENTKEQTKTLGLTYDEIMTDLDEYFPNMKRSDLKDGTKRYMSRSSDDLSLLEITGDKENVEKAYFMLVASSNSTDNVQSITSLAIFLNNTFPNWNNSLDWANDAMDEINTTDIKEKEIKKNGKTLEVSIIKELGMIGFDVEPTE